MELMERIVGGELWWASGAGPLWLPMCALDGYAVSRMLVDVFLGPAWEARRLEHA